jgi:phenylalanyl-tRNA synthetase beta chain
MRVPFGWLQDFVKIDVTPEEVCDYLIMLGFADAQVLPDEWGCLENFVAGRATDVAPHPEDPHLKVVKVNVGYATLTSVCGAPTVNNGEIYALALPGATLGSGKQVETASIGGVESQCILCSGWEAWIDDSRDELLKLDGEIAPGTKLVEALRLDEPVIEMDVTPNRGDWLGLIGVARELAAVFGKELIIPEPSLSEDGPAVEDLASVEILDPEGCPRYGAIALENVEVEGAPAEMRARLRMAGLRPINSVVDAANTVLFETGHPLHAFDLDKIPDGKIIVRRAVKGEKIVAIDGNEYKLSTEDVVIADSEKPIAIAGIIGGKDTEVTAATKRVLIEGAFFNHSFIWRTSKRLGIESDAAYRFARGVDVGAVKYVIARASSLIQCEGECKVSVGMIDVYPAPEPPRHVFVNPKRVNRLLGTAIPEQELLDYLERLGFMVSPGKDLEVVVPTRRSDVGCEADIAEEIARLYGYDRIDSKTRRTCESYGTFPPDARFVNSVREDLKGMGLTEIVTDSTMGPETIKAYGLQPLDIVEIRNPVGIQNSILRPSLLPGLLDVLVSNEHRGQEDLACFELGRTYLRLGSGYQEPLTLAIGVSGPRQPRSWYSKSRTFDFYDLKGILETLAAGLGFRLDFRVGSHELLHPGRRAQVMIEGTDGKKEIGYLGELTRSVSETAGSKRRLYVAEIAMDELVERFTARRKYQELQRFPAVKRDLAVIVEKKILESQVRDVIVGRGGDLVEAAEVFDVYEGDQIPAGTKSLAYAIVLRSPERTLTEQEIDAILGRVEEALKSDLGGSIRRSS